MPKRTDSNQSQIARELRDLGFAVADTHVIGKGFPDLVVGGWSLSGLWLNVLVEVKTEHGQLTPREEEFQRLWRGQVIVARTLNDVLQVFGRRVE